LTKTDRALILEKFILSLEDKPLFGLNEIVAPGQVLTIMGPSGSGKSSLLAAIAGFLGPPFSMSGTVSINGQNILALEPEDRHVGLLFQDPLLFPHLSVGGNVQFACPQHIKGRAVRRDMAERALADVDLAGFYDRHPDSLSGGQKARVALQRVLMAQPVALLLDEPFSKLDMSLRQQIRDLVFATAKRAMLPVLLVTHDDADAEAAGGTVIKIGSDAMR
jgi:putative thiamine transport system ATP-binding protein